MRALIVGTGLGAGLTLAIMNSAAIPALGQAVSLFTSKAPQSSNGVFDQVYGARLEGIKQEPKRFGEFHCARQYEGQVAEVRDFYQSKGVQNLEVPKSDDVCKG